MLLELSLPKGKIVWALAHPVSRGYIHENSGVGYQECQLIVTEKDQPVQVTLEDYPKWAQFMIRSSIGLGQLINTGDPLTKTEPKETGKAKDDTTTKVEEPKNIKKTAKKKRSKKLKNE